MLKDNFDDLESSSGYNSHENSYILKCHKELVEKVDEDKSCGKKSIDIKS